MYHFRLSKILLAFWRLKICLKISSKPSDVSLTSFKAFSSPLMFQVFLTELFNPFQTFKIVLKYLQLRSCPTTRSRWTKHSPPLSTSPPQSGHQKSSSGQIRLYPQETHLNPGTKWLPSGLSSCSAAAWSNFYAQLEPIHWRSLTLSAWHLLKFVGTFFFNFASLPLAGSI